MPEQGIYSTKWRSSSNSRVYLEIDVEKEKEKERETMRGTKGFIYLFLIGIGGLVACHHPSNQDRIWQAADLMRTFPDSADRILEEVIAQASLSDNDRADYWFVRTMVHMVQRRGLVNDSMIAFSVDYYRRHPVFFFKTARFYNACKFAAWQDKEGRNDKRRQETFFLEALDNTRLRNDSSCMEEAYQQLCDFYFEEKAYWKSIETCRNLTLFGDEAKARAWYMTGLCFGRMKNDSCLGYLARAADLADEIKSDHAHHYRRNYAEMLSLSDPKAALACFRRLERDFPQEPHAYAFAELFLRFGKKDSADYYLSELEKQITEAHTSPNNWYITPRVHALALRIAYQARFGLPCNFSLLGNFSDSISFAVIDKVKNEKERAWMQQKLTEENGRIEMDRQRTWVALFAWLFICTAVGSVLFFYIRNRRTKLIEAEEKLETLQQLLREAGTVPGAPETVRPEGPGSAFFRKTLLQQLGMIRLVANTPTQQNQELLQQMARIANEDVPVDALLVWEDLYAVIDSVYDCFYTRLTRYATGRLSEKEIQVCCLLCAGFSTKEIGVVTRQSVRTVYQRKTNIRHALEMGEKDDIVGFIDKATA